MKYKVIREAQGLKKGDVLEQDGGLWSVHEETENSVRDVIMGQEIVDLLLEDGILLAEEQDCLEKVKGFVNEKLAQYQRDYEQMMESYNNQDIPNCVKVEAETVYYNMTKLLNAIRDIVNE